MSLLLWYLNTKVKKYALVHFFSVKSGRFGRTDKPCGSGYVAKQHWQHCRRVCTFLWNMFLYSAFSHLCSYFRTFWHQENLQVLSIFHDKRSQPQGALYLLKQAQSTDSEPDQQPPSKPTRPHIWWESEKHLEEPLPCTQSSHQGSQVASMMKELG